MKASPLVKLFFAVCLLYGGASAQSPVAAGVKHFSTEALGSRRLPLSFKRTKALRFTHVRAIQAAKR
jgi:hypothetical protein